MTQEDPQLEETRLKRAHWQRWRPNLHERALMSGRRRRINYSKDAARGITETWRRATSRINRTH